MMISDHNNETIRLPDKAGSLILFGYWSSVGDPEIKIGVKGK